MLSARFDNGLVIRGVDMPGWPETMRVTSHSMQATRDAASRDGAEFHRAG